MVCPQCRINPLSHSFVKFGQKGAIGYWYTAAGEAEELVDTPEKFGFFRLHMNQAKQDAHWIWVFDCAGMTNRHYTSLDFMKRLVGALCDEHAEILDAIWIVNPNMWIRAAVMIMSPFMNKRLVEKISFVEDTGIGFLLRLTGVRILSSPWRKATANSKKNEVYLQRN
jgi:hypothetical protein